VTRGLMLDQGGEGLKVGGKGIGSLSGGGKESRKGNKKRKDDQHPFQESIEHLGCLERAVCTRAGKKAGTNKKKQKKEAKARDGRRGGPGRLFRTPQCRGPPETARGGTDAKLGTRERRKRRLGIGVSVGKDFSASVIIRRGFTWRAEKICGGRGRKSANKCGEA